MRLLPALLLAGCATAPSVVAVRGDLAGSGVAVAPDRVVTAAHLIGDNLNRSEDACRHTLVGGIVSGAAGPAGPLVRGCHKRGNEAPRRAYLGSVQVLRRVSAGRALRSEGRVLSVSGDVAVLRVARGISAGTVEIGPPLSAGDECEILDGTVWPAAHISCTAVASDSVRPSIRMDRVGPGLSGAPVLDGKGRLAGIVSGTLIGVSGGPLVLISRIEAP